MKIYATLALLVALVVIIPVVHPFVWFRILRSEVVRNGQPISNARLYKYRTGAILIVLDDSNPAYLLDPAHRSVAFLAADLWLQTSIICLMKTPAESIALGSPKTESPAPNLVLSDSGAQFVDYHGQLLQITWR